MKLLCFGHQVRGKPVDKGHTVFCNRHPQGGIMGLDDKISNKAEDLGGKAKEATGSATGNRDLEAEGKGDQASSAIKDAGEKIKDAASTVKDKLTGH